jgi:Na+-transporting NADH:ubiquinone oxidoreductase subunit NqrF
MSNLLTESLQASVALETNKKQLLKAATYLTIAQHAFSRYAEWKRNSERYSEAWRRLEAWTFINTQERTEKRAADALAAYHRCMNSYRKILFTLFTNKN